jgi:membrane associated rhomboid family serine protease
MTNAPTETPVCYRHAKRETYVRCSRCDRYICPDCMRSAAVGQHCLDCVREASKGVRQPRTISAGQLRATWTGGGAVVTYSLIAINVAAYIVELVRPGVVNQLGMLGNALMQGGHFDIAPGVVISGFHPAGVAHGEWYRLITGPFLHDPPSQGIGVLHIVLNMWWLFMLGPILEARLGRLRFVALYLLSALGSSVLVYLLAPRVLTIGASGAVFGLVGAYFVIGRRFSVDRANSTRLLVYSAVWLVVSSLIDSWQGHLGGLITGILVGLAYTFIPQRRTAVQVAAISGVTVLLILAIVLRTLQLS